MKPLSSILSGDFNPEQQMLVNRILCGSASAIGCYLIAFDALILFAFVTYVAATAGLYVVQKKGSLSQEKRYFAAIIFDASLAFAIMSHSPAQMAVFYPALLWLALSNGFRFGIQWLAIAALVSSASFAAVVMTTTYWQENLTLGLGLTFALLAIPAYCSTLIRNISDAKAQAETASKAKSYFLASVSHELRTPLNAIIGYGNHLRQSNMPSGQKDMVEASVLAGEHLLHLIEQLIDVAKAGTGKTQVKRTAFRPTDLLIEIREIMTVRVEEKGLAIHLQAEPMSDQLVDGPVSVIRNILLNLVGNATKFTEVGSITIGCGLVNRNNKSAIWFAVTDTGIGIPDAAKERIFQPFQQADETVMNRFGGTGLGLSICRQLTEQVDGDISVASKIGQGSTFRIEIPVEALEQPSQFDEVHAGAVVNILAFGNVHTDILAGMQAIENFRVRHIECADGSALAAGLSGLDLTQFQVAFIPQSLAKDIAPYDNIWALFADADVAPVLVSEAATDSLEQIAQTAPFTSALPATPNFLEIRSAVRIGCAFARKMRMSNVELSNEIKTYTPKRVLVADDNRTNRNVLAAILEAAGHYVSMATDGDEALAELKNGKIDILLLDVNMPRLNGLDACMMWRQSESGRSHLPIIGVTADATTETEAKCLAAGMDLRITKPVNAQLLLATIEHYCADGSGEPLSADRIHPSHRDVVVPISRDAVSAGDVIDGAQIQYLRSIGDQAFVNTMIDGFLEDIGQTLEPLQCAVKSGDVAEFRFCAHALKSSGNNMGARSLSRLCGPLEKITEVDLAQNGPEYLARIEKEITRTVAALKTDFYTGEVPAIAKTG